MRVGLVGGMANAMYCLTRVLRQQGYDAEYVEDPQEIFPLAQPFWEEVPVTLDWASLGSSVADVSAWLELAERSGWRSPPWVVRPVEAGRRDRAVRRARAALRAWQPGGRKRVRDVRAREPMADELVSPPLVEQLASYDRLVACGIRSVDALLSGRPYVLWPHGGDVHIVPFQTGTPVESAFGRMMREVVIRADVVGTHDPRIAARVEELGRPGPIPYLPFVVDTERYSPGPVETALAREIRAAAGDRLVLLLCSRQDFYWKGTDRFARAFAANAAAGAPFYLVVPAWGADVEATRQIFVDAGVLGSVHYLSSAVSKPVLRDLYRASDVVVDQFSATSFGAVMVEAMACGAPVMINLDLDEFRAQWPNFEPPPTLRACTEKEIAALLSSIADGTLDVGELGRKSREWVEEYHGPDKARLYVGERP